MKLLVKKLISQNTQRTPFRQYDLEWENRECSERLVSFKPSYNTPTTALGAPISGSKVSSGLHFKIQNFAKFLYLRRYKLGITSMFLKLQPDVCYWRSQLVEPVILSSYNPKSVIRIKS